MYTLSYAQPGHLHGTRRYILIVDIYCFDAAGFSFAPQDAVYMRKPWQAIAAQAWAVWLASQCCFWTQLLTNDLNV